jgi:Kef-type K+ transport system membrane component KefB
MTPARSIGRISLTAAYTAMIVGGIALFFLIRSVGETLIAPARAGEAATPVGTAPAGPDTLFHVLLALAAVLAIGRLLGRWFAAAGQAPVIGEVVAGILLGPSLLGRAAPTVAAYILPPSVAPFLSVIAQLGIVLYMFLVGLELNTDIVRTHARGTVATSHASILAPFLLGTALALYLYPRLSSNDVSFTTFALFLGVAMSITAFPVLARILTDRGTSHTELGVVALTCAAADDVTAWCLLALVVGVAEEQLSTAAVVAVLGVAFIGVMLLVVRPLLLRGATRADRMPPQALMALGLLCLLLSALITEWIGIHAIFGAFIFGAVVPHDSRVARLMIERLQDVVTILLLPAFFAVTGMRTEIGLLSDAAEWLMCGLIIVVATAGKFGGTLVAARMTGMGWRAAAALGVLMNTRGLMELIVLNIGLDLNVISPTLFTMMVLMALATTLATTPLLDMVGAAAFEGDHLESPPAVVQRSGTE